MTRREAERLRWLWLWLGLGWLQVGVVLLLGLTPSDDLPSAAFRVNDKAVHFLEFFLLMSWFAGIVRPQRYWRVAVLLLGLGAGIELLQGFIETRATDAADMAANASGIAAAWLLARLFLGQWCRQVERWLVAR